MTWFQSGPIFNVSWPKHAECVTVARPDGCCNQTSAVAVSSLFQRNWAAIASFDRLTYHCYLLGNRHSIEMRERKELWCRSPGVPGVPACRFNPLMKT